MSADSTTAMASSAGTGVDPTTVPTTGDLHDVLPVQDSQCRPGANHDVAASCCIDVLMESCIDAV